MSRHTLFLAFATVELLAAALLGNLALRQVRSVFVASASAPREEVVALQPGCTRANLSWPVGTPISEVLARIAPQESVQALWQFNQTGAPVRYQPAAAATIRAQPERVVVCLSTAGLLRRPAGFADRLVAVPDPAAAPTERQSDLPSSQVGPIRSSPAAGVPVAGRRPLARSADVAEPVLPFALLPPEASLPSEARCAAAVPRSTWEPRPQNGEANRTRGAALAVEPVRGIDVSRITGNFIGTTDEILQWGACKWGLDPDLLRAMAVQESAWRQTVDGNEGASIGLLQIRLARHPGTLPAARQSTAFNVDYVAGWLRACYEGKFRDRLSPEARGDLWGCVGAWYSDRWRDVDATLYSDLVRRHYAERPWLEPEF